MKQFKMTPVQQAIAILLYFGGIVLGSMVGTLLAMGLG